MPDPIDSINNPKNHIPTPRSPLLMNRDNSMLVVIDVQEKLLPAITDNDRVAWNIQRLVRGAGVLSVPVVATEQYPKGLGKTVKSIASELPKDAFSEKRMFSCRECHELFTGLIEKGIHNLVIVGVETHVCIMQSSLDFMSQGFDVFVAVDATGSRFDIDHETALCRLELSGATLVSSEMVLFEWCETARAAEFKTISKLAQEPFDPNQN